ncbi:hypothetical protein, partial [Klebsiella pneumoniae]
KVKLPPSLRQALEEQIEKYKDAYDKADKTKTAIKLFGIEVTISGNKAQNAAIEQQKHADAIKNTKQAADEAQKSLKEMYDQKNLDTDFLTINIKSHGLEMGKALSDFYDNNKIPKTRSLTKDEWAIFQKNFDK